MKTLLLSVPLAGASAIAVVQPQDSPSAVPEVADHGAVLEGAEVMRRVLARSLADDMEAIGGIPGIATRYYAGDQEDAPDPGDMASALGAYLSGVYGSTPMDRGRVEYLPGLAAILHFSVPVRGEWVREQAEGTEEQPVLDEGDLWDEVLDEVRKKEDPLEHLIDRQNRQASGSMASLLQEARRDARRREFSASALAALLDSIVQTLAQYGGRIGLAEEEQLVVSLDLRMTMVGGSGVPARRPGGDPLLTLSELAHASRLTGMNGSAQEDPGLPQLPRSQRLVVRASARDLKQYGSGMMSIHDFSSRIRVDRF